MVIRTPRRRISPRTKRRYKAIKSFLARALGTSSQRNINTNSSIEISVSNLKSKIASIEEELNKVSKHCQDLTCIQKSFVKEQQSRSKLSEAETSRKKSKCDSIKCVETKVLYEKPEGHFRIRDDSHNIKTKNNDNNMNSRLSYQNLQKFQHQINRTKNNESEKHQLHRRQHRAKSKHDIAPPVYSTSSFHSLVTPKYKQYAEPGYSGYRSKQREKEPRISSPEFHRKRQTLENDHKYSKYEQKQVKPKRNKREYSSVDQEFIEKIINKQYRPVKMFGRRDSDFSQFSAPVCRDHEFIIHEEIQEGSELCSCCFDDNRKHRHRYTRHHDLTDLRSVCDTRLYSSKKHHRYTYPSRNIEDYHNSAYYDVVPVKEKSSPKSRRKFAEENAIKYQYKEVPPSPRTRRPRLNLRAQNYTEYDDIEGYSSQMPPIRQHRSYESESNVFIQQDKPIKYQNVSVQHQTHNGTMSSLQSPNFVDGQRNKTNNDTTLSTELTDTNVDKTDKALGEIKDILQSFLTEIKKESTHSGKSNITSKLGERNFNESQESDKLNTTINPNSANNFNMAQCNMPPFVPPLPSPCCYPIIPVCPMNYMQNGYMMPSPSYTCTVCAESSKERTSTEKENKTKTDKDNVNNETQELIKEIYKYVSQNSKSISKADNRSENSPKNSPKNNKVERILFTNRSAGGCSKTSKHDANVGTPHMRCLSKSCEAIGSRINSDTYYSTNASYSDTVLEKLSLHGSQSSTDTDVSSEVAERKIHRNKFQKLLQSLRLFKKKKKDIIVEESESDTTTEVAKTHQKPRPPFKQHVTNYAMHGQEYFNPPPIPENSYPPHHDRHYGYHHGFPHQPHALNCNQCEHHVNNSIYSYDQRPPNYNPMSHSPHPSYIPYQAPPQVPLCLKEVEVKTIGTQSQRKMSIFSKFTKKPPLYRQDASQQYTPPSVEKPSFWKAMQEKAREQQKNQQKHPDPMDFSLKTQKQLAEGDLKLRNAMLKKLFYKRNPFSPRNLIVRTLLGKDKSSFGDPPKMYRPRMFI